MKTMTYTAARIISHLMNWTPTEERMAAKCMEMRTSALDMHAQMMVTVTVATKDIFVTKENVFLVAIPMMIAF